MSDKLFLIPSDRVQPLPLCVVDEILNAVQYPPKSADRERLRRELALFNHWEAVKRLFHKSATTDGSKSAIEIAEKAETLLDLLLESPSETLSRHKASIWALTYEARREAERSAPRMDIAISAFEWLVSEHLAGLYTRVFGRKAAISKHSLTSEVQGPFVRFVESVLRHNDIRKPDGAPYTTSSIDAALKRAKGKRNNTSSHPIQSH